MTTINHCANTCTNAGGDPITTEGRSHLCTRCEDNLDRWLGGIATTWPLLPLFVEHGTTESNPDSKATKRAEAPAPMRLEIIDLLDTRLGRIWNGTAPASDRRGVAGTIGAHVDRLAEERNLTVLPAPGDVGEGARLLRRHRLWLAEQDWIADLYEEIRVLHRQLSDAVGDYRPRPVGKCHLVPQEDAGACGGPLMANRVGGVRCGRCRATWDAGHLRQLGLAQAAEEAS